MDKLGKNLKVIMDLQSIPDDINLDQFYSIIKNSGIIIWDSTLGGKKPELIDESELSLMDVGFLSKEQFEEKFNNIKED